MIRSSSEMKRSLVVHRRNNVSVRCDSSEFLRGLGRLPLMVHSGGVCECGCYCWYFVVIKYLSHCSGLSNTESGSTEIFSFFSGQLYSFGNFVYIKRKDTQAIEQNHPKKFKYKV